jgi:hypothetical protein
LTPTLYRRIDDAVWAAASAVRVAHRTLSLLPGYVCLAGLVGDTILGPAEVCEYVSKTTPNGPPPTTS